MLQSRRPGWLTYGLAVGLTILALVLTLVTPLKGGSPFLLFIGAVLISARYGGWGPALLAILLSAVVSAYFLLPTLLAFPITSPDDLLRFTTFVLLALLVGALSSERERIKGAAQMRAQQQAAVTTLGLDALAIHDMDRVFERTTETVCETLGTELGNVMELLPGGKELLLRAGWGWNPGVVGHARVPAGHESPAGYTLIVASPVVARDLQKEKRFARPSLLTDHHVVSAMTVVIAGHGSPYGVIGAYSKRKRSFSQDDVNFLQAVANVLATVVERARTEISLQEELAAQRHAEEALRESEERYRTVAETATDGIITIDDTSRILFVNPAAEQIFGYSRDELIGADLAMLMPLDQRGEHGATLQQYIETGTPHMSWKGVAVPGLHKSGRVVPLEISFGEFVRGKRHYFTSVIRDVSERRAAEEKLQFQANVLRNVRDSVIVTDPEGKITFWNEGATSIFGYTAEEMMGQLPAQLYPDLDNSAYATDLAQIRRGQDYVGEWKGRRKDGRTIWVGIKTTLLSDAAGETVGYIGVASDITERKYAEERLGVQYAVTRALAESDTLAQVTPPILQAICEWTGWEVGIIWDLDHKADVLRCVDMWHRRALDVRDFESLSREMLFVRGLGLPGQVWDTRHPIWIPDIGETPGFPRGKVAARNDLHGAVAFPILAGDEFTGVAEFYSRQVREPDRALVELMDALGSQIGQFIERKRTESQLRLSEEQHSIILQGVADGITAQDASGHLVYANQAAAEMIGFATPEELLNTPLDRVVDRFTIMDEDGKPLDASQMPGRIAIHEKRANTAVLRFGVNNSNVERWSVVNGTPILDSDGNVLYAINIFHDVTERMRVEDDMRQQRELLRVTLASIGDAVISTDAKGFVTFMNPMAEALTACTLDEAMGKSLDDVFPLYDEDTRARQECPATRVLRERTIVGLSNHTVLVAKDGKSTPIDDSAAPIRDTHGNIIGTVIVFRDVTARRHTDEDISRLAAIVKSTDDAIISKTLEGKILTWNPGAERLFGYKAEEVIGKSIMIIYPPDRLFEFESNMTRVRRGESIDHFDTVRVAKDGRLINVSLSLSVLRDGQGHVIGASKILRDITEQKWNEETQRFLAETSDVLSSSLDYETTLTSVARLVVPRIADWCAVYIKMEDGSVQELALAHVDPAKLALVHEYQRLFPEDPDGERGVPGVIRSGKPTLVPEITDEMLTASVKDVQQLKLLLDIGLRSSMVVPLTARGRTLGAITFVSAESGRHFAAREFALAQDLARRAALAVDNARLYREAQSLNEQLEQRVIRRTVELQSANRRLETEMAARQRMTDQLRLLSGHLQSAREEERIRIAREIHDEIGQVLTAVKMDLALLGKEIGGNGDRPGAESLKEDIASTTNLVDGAIQTMHHIVRELRPEVLDHLGLHAALEWQVQEFQARTKIKCDFVTEMGEIDLDPERSTAVFRILQETLTNIARHADATQVDVCVRKEDNYLVLTVQDNGKGISADELENTTRFGILGMRERAHAFGGRVIIEGAPDQGTLVTARIPL